MVSATVHHSRYAWTCSDDKAETSKSKIRKQVAAPPVRLDREGRLRVLLVTSLEPKRFIISKG